jgi:K+-transporting ATPase KdpF subunit
MSRSRLSCSEPKSFADGWETSMAVDVLVVLLVLLVIYLLYAVIHPERF